LIARLHAQGFASFARDHNLVLRRENYLGHHLQSYSRQLRLSRYGRIPPFHLEEPCASYKPCC
jgi:hypothetical protein